MDGGGAPVLESHPRTRARIGERLMLQEDRSVGRRHWDGTLPKRGTGHGKARSACVWRDKDLRRGRKIDLLVVGILFH